MEWKTNFLCRGFLLYRALMSSIDVADEQVQITVKRLNIYCTIISKRWCKYFISKKGRQRSYSNQPVHSHSSCDTDCCQGHRIPKSQAGNTWRKDKETFSATYMAIGRSFNKYMASIWSLECSEMQTKKLQLSKNTAIWPKTGYVLMSRVEQLRNEVCVLPIENAMQSASSSFH